MDAGFRIAEMVSHVVQNVTSRATGLRDSDDVDPFTAIWWTYTAISALLVCFAGIMSGLTLGLLSMSVVDLEVLKESGNRNEKKQAASIYPVVVKQHQLLVTLLLCNAAAMEALPLFLDALVSPVLAVVLSVTLVLLFGEVIPQAICSRYGLLIGSNLIWLVKLLMVVCYPVAFPMGKLLDYLLGHEEPLFRRKQLKALVSIHGADAGRGGELTHDETTIMRGALDLTSKTAEEAMTPIESTFSLDINTRLDRDSIRIIDEKGHSRVPVYEGDKKNIIGVVLVKSLLTLNFNEAPPLRSVAIRRIPRMPATMPLYNVLNEFQKGSSHIAVVIKKKRSRSFDYGSRNRESQAPQPLPSLRLSDKYPPAVADDIVLSMSKSSMIPQLETSNLKKEGSYQDFGSEDAVVTIEKSPETFSREDEEEEKTVESMVRVRSLKNLKSSELDTNKDQEKSQEETEMNGNVILEDKSFETGGNKTGGWKQKSSKKILIEGGFEWKQSRYSDEEVIGIITLEDIIEELLQEEIVDETDEYIDVHKKIRVTSTLGNQGFVFKKTAAHKNTHSYPHIFDDHHFLPKNYISKAFHETKNEDRNEEYYYTEIREPMLKNTSYT